MRGIDLSDKKALVLGVANQRSLEACESALVLPAREVLLIDPFYEDFSRRLHQAQERDGVNLDTLLDAQGLSQSAQLKAFTIQDSGGTRKTIARGVAALREMLPDANQVAREPVPASVIRVAVMRHPTPDEWSAVRDIFEPDWLQTDVTDLASLKLGSRCTALPVYRNAQIDDEQKWPSPILFEGASSGTGQPADWQRAAAIAACSDLILAGGLNASNVTEAIAAVRPWGVDVSSGVESGPGTKDPK